MTKDDFIKKYMPAIDPQIGRKQIREIEIQMNKDIDSLLKTFVRQITGNQHIELENNRFECSCGMKISINSCCNICDNDE